MIRSNRVSVWVLVTCVLAIIFSAETLIRGHAREFSLLGLLADRIMFVFSETPIQHQAIIGVFQLYFLLSVCSQIVFIICLIKVIHPRGEEGISKLSQLTYMMIQLMVVVLDHSELSHVLAVELAYFLVWRLAWKLMLIQCTLFSLTKWMYFIWIGVPVTLKTFGSEVFYIFMVEAIPFFIGYVIVKEQRIASQLILAQQEIERCQTLVLEAIRNEERERIENNLHDLIGHQLTTLNLHIDLAIRHLEIDAPEVKQSAIKQSIEVAKLSAFELLTHVRSLPLKDN